VTKNEEAKGTTEGAKGTTEGAKGTTEGASIWKVAIYGQIE
jgi:hypothetical protein